MTLVHRGAAIRPLFALLVAALVAALFFACGDDDDSTPSGSGTPGPTQADLSGSIEGDGSSTVFPITEAVAEEFHKVQKNVDVVVGISGTGGGFKKFCDGETDFNDASRPIKDEEMQTCSANGVDYVEFQVAFDGLSVVVNAGNDFVDCLTVAELKKIWEPGSTVDKWSDVRADFPSQSITLYGPGTDSGTFDYFTEVIMGEVDKSRADYTASEDDNVLVQGVAGDDNALGYFGFAYYEENADSLKLLGVDSGAGCVQPSAETIESGEYSPLSRPLFVYVRADALQRREVAAFMRFYLTEGVALVREVGYVAAPEEVYAQGLALLP